jgi:hypothetical protein
MGTRREMMKDFARAARLAKEEGNLEIWRVAATQWRRLATLGEQKRAPDYLGLH